MNMMLFKPQDSEDRERLLKAIINLEDNKDFNELMAYIVANKTNLAQQSCIQLGSEELSKRQAGGFITLLELEQLVMGAESQLEELKKAGKKKAARRRK